MYNQVIYKISRTEISYDTSDVKKDIKHVHTSEKLDAKRYMTRYIIHAQYLCTSTTDHND